MAPRDFNTKESRGPRGVPLSLMTRGAAPVEAGGRLGEADQSVGSEVSFCADIRGERRNYFPPGEGQRVAR